LDENVHAMNIATEKKALIKQFNELQDVALIEAIKSLLMPKEQEKTNSQSEAKHSLSYSPEIIEGKNRKYVLNYPLRSLFETRTTISQLKMNCWIYMPSAKMERKLKKISMRSLIIYTKG
jgi:hypothetical protein